MKIMELKCAEVSDEMAIKIAGFNNHLKLLNIGNINDRNLIIIVEGCSALEHLNLGGCRRLCDISISKVAERCVHLK